MFPVPSSRSPSPRHVPRPLVVFPVLSSCSRSLRRVPHPLVTFSVLSSRSSSRSPSSRCAPHPLIVFLVPSSRSLSPRRVPCPLVAFPVLSSHFRFARCVLPSPNRFPVPSLCPLSSHHVSGLVVLFAVISLGARKALRGITSLGGQEASKKVLCWSK